MVRYFLALFILCFQFLDPCSLLSLEHRAQLFTLLKLSLHSADFQPQRVDSTVAIRPELINRNQLTFDSFILFERGFKFFLQLENLLPILFFQILVLSE